MYVNDGQGKGRQIPTLFVKSQSNTSRTRVRVKLGVDKEKGKKLFMTSFTLGGGFFFLFRA